MNYHYQVSSEPFATEDQNKLKLTVSLLQTQPVPNPIAYYLHQSPEWVHAFEVLGNHFIELVAPFLLLLPRRLAIVGGCIQILFQVRFSINNSALRMYCRCASRDVTCLQVVLIVSGNLSFLNWLTIVPALACFDDRSVAWMFSSASGSVKHQVAKLQSTSHAPSHSMRLN